MMAAAAVFIFQTVIIINLNARRQKLRHLSHAFMLTLARQHKP